MLERVARLTWRRPRLVLLLTGLLAATAIGFGHDVEHHLKAAGFTDSASESERAARVMHDALGYDAGPGLIVVLRAKDGGRLDLNAPATRREVQRLTSALRGVDGIGLVDSPLTRGPVGLRAADGRSALLAAHLRTLDVQDVGGQVSDRAERALRSGKLDVRITGFAPGFSQVNDQTRKDLTRAELIAFPVLALLLLLVFRSAVAAAIPLLIGGLSILGAFLALRIMSSFVDTSLFALNISSGLSLGLAVDYALLMISRYREEIALGASLEEAHRRTVLGAGRTALFSGLTVAVALASLLVMPQRFLYSIGAAGAIVGIVAALASLFVVPALLAVLGPRIDAFAIRRRSPVSAESDRWNRLARGVMRRPVLVGLASAALMLAAAASLPGTTLTGPSGEAVSPGLAAYEPFQYVGDHYERDVLEPVTVVVRGRADAAELRAYAQRLRAVPHVTGGTPFQRVNGNVAVASLALDGPALSASSQDAVRTVRDLPPPGRADVLVNGNTAQFLDQKASLRDHAPLVIALVAAGTLLLLFLLTGSIILPLKTLVMNALTLSATLGLLVVGFQQGVLSGVLDDTGPDAIEVTSLVFLFAVTFALATDYSVLVMARIKELHDHGLSNEDAVAVGIGRTGRIISAAAVMIAVVFLAFAFSPIFFMKQIAIGMAVGVILDATIVRALLVPALMRLLGERNWWAPAPLARFQRRFGLREGPSAGAPPPATENA